MAELQMDKLAEKLGLDPVDFRHRNALREGDTLWCGNPCSRQGEYRGVHRGRTRQVWMG